MWKSFTVGVETHKFVQNKHKTAAEVFFRKTAHKNVHPQEQGKGHFFSEWTELLNTLH